ncbi:MAG: dicarboxylate/amino acid:cation symporter, partial [Sphingomonadaceae bacterium]|nr:dicarboxylate/amino acid:cation symporter [Sphingomonadaceae bacterium]
MARKLTYFILAGLVLGILVGWAINATVGDGTPAGTARLAAYAHYISILTTVFLNLIKMIIAPLVLSTMIVGIAHMGDTAALGRVGFKAVGWFVGASLVSLTLGLILVTLLKPGVGLGLPLPPASASSGVDRAAFDFATFVSHIFPQSMIDAMASNSILQIVVFSLFLGVAITAVGEPARPLVRAMEGLAKVMLQVTDYVMRFAPIAVFAAVSATIAEHGPSILGTFGYFMGSFYAGLVLLWILLFGAAFLVAGSRTRLLARYIRDPIVLAFSTASSEAAFPRTLEALERFGVPPRIASFVLPLGYSFNLDGSMMYQTFAALFVAQAFGVDMPITTQITMLLVLMVSSKGIAGVPRASLVVVAATLPTFGLPTAGLVLLIGIDQFIDMGR